MSVERKPPKSARCVMAYQNQMNVITERNMPSFLRVFALNEDLSNVDGNKHVLTIEYKHYVNTNNRVYSLKRWIFGLIVCLFSFSIKQIRFRSTRVRGIDSNTYGREGQNIAICESLGKKGFAISTIMKRELSGTVRIVQRAITRMSKTSFNLVSTKISNKKIPKYMTHAQNPIISIMIS